MMVFDLDPGPRTSLIECLDIGLRLRKALQTIGLESFPKTSGSKGLHVVVPLNGKSVTYEQTKSLARSLADALEAHDRDHITTNMRKSEREGKVFVDWSQNDVHKTTVCAYSLRARPHPNVAAPVSWEEVQRALKRGDTKSLVFEADDMHKRVKKLGDLYEPVESLRQKLPQLAAAISARANDRSQRPARSTRGTTRSASPASSK
jgi:bifunctional non-homologous end joining protein LigD